MTPPREKGVVFVVENKTLQHKRVWWYTRIKQTGAKNAPTDALLPEGLFDAMVW